MVSYFIFTSVDGADKMIALSDIFIIYCGLIFFVCFVRSSRIYAGMYCINFRVPAPGGGAGIKTVKKQFKKKGNRKKNRKGSRTPKSRRSGCTASQEN